MNFDFHSVLELLTSFQAFLFSLFLLSSSRKRKMSNLFIALFLMLLALNISYNFISDYLDQISQNLTVFIMMSAFLMAPALYLHIKASLDPDFKLSWRDSFHLFPFVLFNMFILNDIYIVNALGEELPTFLERSLNLVLYIGFYIVFFAYLVKGFYLLSKTKKLYFENYSNTDIRKFNYLFQLNILVSSVILSSVIKNAIVYSRNKALIGDSIVIVLLLILVLFCWIIYKGLNAPELFNHQPKELSLVSELIKEVESEENNDVSEVDRQLVMEVSTENIERLKLFMQEDKPFLVPTLSLEELATNLDIPSRELSILINHHLNKHFFDFINEYRINEAKDILSDPSKSDFTVLEILYEVGFNSKSSFNTAFKKLTGSTPTQYRKNTVLAS